MNRQFKFTTCKNQYLVLIILLLTGLMMFGLGQTSSAQIIRIKPTPTPQVRATPPAQRNAMVFKGTGALQKNPELARFGEQIPKSLTAEEKSAALREVMLANRVVIRNNNFPVQTYVMLNSQTPYVAGKGNLSYVGSVWVDPLSLEGWVIGDTNFLGVFSGKIKFFIKPDQIGRWFMIDCKVVPRTTGGEPFHLTGPDGNTTEIAYPADGHLKTFMVSQNTEWQKFTLERNDVFRLYSCEVTTPAQ
jgi:hypothetical protein